MNRSLYVCKVMHAAVTLHYFICRCELLAWIFDVHRIRNQHVRLIIDIGLLVAPPARQV